MQNYAAAIFCTQKYISRCRFERDRQKLALSRTLGTAIELVSSFLRLKLRKRNSVKTLLRLQQIIY